MDYVVPTTTSPTLASLNTKAIEKLYTLVEAFDAKTDPEMILACTKGIAQLNSSLKGSDILPKQETDEERQMRETSSVLEAELGE